MTGAWCARALIHDIPMERRSINANPAPSPSSREKLWPCQKVTLSPDPRLSFSLNPTIHPALLHPSVHPSLPVSTAFASLLALSLSFYPSRFFSLLRVTLSHVSLSSFNTQFASNTSRRLPMRSRGAKGQALKNVCVHTNTVSYLNCSAREDISGKGKENFSSRTGEEPVWGVLGRWHVEWCSGNKERPWTWGWYCSCEMKG